MEMKYIIGIIIALVLILIGVYISAKGGGSMFGAFDTLKGALS